ncbi:MAG: phosphotransferase family protein [Terricaulis sp.]
MSKASPGPLSVQQFRGGQSNPTYQLVTPTKKYVLRKKPAGKLLPSAHAVDREFRVISALHPTGFPVARPYALCTDDSVLGAMFYVMDMVEGRVLWNGGLPDMTPPQRRAIYEGKGRHARAPAQHRSRRHRPSAITARPAIISRARSIAGASNTNSANPIHSRDGSPDRVVADLDPARRTHRDRSR